MKLVQVGVFFLSELKIPQHINMTSALLLFINNSTNVISLNSPDFASKR